MDNNGEDRKEDGGNTDMVGKGVSHESKTMEVKPTATQSVPSKPTSNGSKLSSSKMRIKLKMPKISASGLPSHPRRPAVSSNGEAPHRSDKMLPLASKSASLLSAAARIKQTLSSEAGASSSAASAHNAAGNKPKPRIRSLKLPLSKTASTGDGTVHATVVNSDDEDADTEVNARVATVVSSDQMSSSTAKLGGKRRSTQTGRVKIPPVLSPGLRVAAPQSNKQLQQQDSSFSTPAQVFNHAMEEAGYTVEARTNKPHRGSSTARVVGDMFDSDVKLSLHFPPLVPRGLWNATVQSGSASPKPYNEQPGNEQPDNENRRTKVLLADRLIQALRTSNTGPPTDVVRKKNGKRPRSWGIHEMLPVTLTLPYPESFIEQQQEYVQRVQRRERAIRRKQEADLEADGQGSTTVDVPDIPELPTPPPISQLPGFFDEHKDHHPLHPPNTQRDFVGHLDKECFHISEGRYFGLSTNKIADPIFVGANAPGVSGSNAAGGAGLATATSGSQATAFILNSSFYGNASDHAKPDLLPEETKEEKTKANKQEQRGPSPSKPTSKKPSPTDNKKKKSTTGQSSSSTPTASTSMLRKIMDEGGSTSNALRQSIIRAAVHAGRTGKHGQAFKFGDKIFPDVSKAFAAFAGVKPCQRCKNNKQGAYHCRLRRRHFDDDFDGGGSAQELKPLFEMPIEDLLV
mmetsp:Transcript_26610/g.73434  ORF Transcript_26610/g.73434 Transcript_26610/m.73434 type:complete len:687 (-) Transcript_26610:91-2151(-)